ncbi:hypothetical protein PAECIP111891_01938 [Paenibacillus allorhizoplanae]|uniref:Uncharacterized protein n=1 Tax=Paenibacillus allorhizoplanae TaxID=2905648 RepID=A0ABN8GE34_9BACL|nr:hypothetical protein PAECIP111891_01938 [Paenibacillus allorhizoplanae]
MIEMLEMLSVIKVALSCFSSIFPNYNEDYSAISDYQISAESFARIRTFSQDYCIFSEESACYTEITPLRSDGLNEKEVVSWISR